MCAGGRALEHPQPPPEHGRLSRWLAAFGRCPVSISEQIGTQARTSSGGEVSGDRGVSATVVDSPGVGCMEPGSVHLLMADTALFEQHRCWLYLALCGAELTADRLPPWDCPEGCTCADVLICPDCVRRAAELSPR